MWAVLSLLNAVCIFDPGFAYRSSPLKEQHRQFRGPLGNSTNRASPSSNGTAFAATTSQSENAILANLMAVAAKRTASKNVLKSLAVVTTSPNKSDTPAKLTFKPPRKVADKKDTNVGLTYANVSDQISALYKIKEAKVQGRRGGMEEGEEEEDQEREDEGEEVEVEEDDDEDEGENDDVDDEGKEVVVVEEEDVQPWSAPIDPLEAWSLPSVAVAVETMNKSLVRKGQKSAQEVKNISAAHANLRESMKELDWYEADNILKKFNYEADHIMAKLAKGTKNLSAAHESTHAKLRGSKKVGQGWLRKTLKKRRRARKEKKEKKKEKRKEKRGRKR